MNSYLVQIVPYWATFFAFELSILIPWPFNGFVSGFESFGWIVMFFGGRKLVQKAIKEQSYTEENAR